MGDFEVEGELTVPTYDQSYWKRWGLKPDLVNLKATSATLTDPKPPQINDLIESGMPFYAGMVEYAIQMPEISLERYQGVYMSLEKLNAACVEVFVNDDKIGYITARPYRLDISEYYKPGRRLRIILYSTLRNLLGPHHHKDGELMFNSPLSFLPDIENHESYCDLVKNWLEDNAELSNWNEDYSLVAFGDLGEISLKLKIS